MSLNQVSGGATDGHKPAHNRNRLGASAAIGVVACWHKLTQNLFPDLFQPGFYPGVLQIAYRFGGGKIFLDLAVKLAASACRAAAIFPLFQVGSVFFQLLDGGHLFFWCSMQANITLANIAAAKMARTALIRLLILLWFPISHAASGRIFFLIATELRHVKQGRRRSLLLCHFAVANPVAPIFF